MTVVLDSGWGGVVVARVISESNEARDVGIVEEQFENDPVSNLAFNRRREAILVSSISI